MLGIRIPADYFHVTADALRWRIARFVFNHSTIDFLQLRVINISPERILYRIQINPVTVSCDLHAIANPAGAIFHELMRPSAIPSAD